MAEKSGDMVQVNLRLPQPLKDKLAKAARRNKRSFNAELVHRLQAPVADQIVTPEDIASRAATEAVELLVQRLGIKPKA